jgi:tetratricopeptide (TPR) repeat protein
MAKRWQKDQVTYLKRYAKTRTLAELADRFRTDAATVESKLVELELKSKEGRGFAAPRPDPNLDRYEKGIKAIFGKKWKEAEKLFQQVVTQSDHPELMKSARAYLAAVRQNAETVSENGGEDPYLQAVVAKNDGDFDTAAELCSRGGRKGKDERFTYLAASIHALSGEAEEAVRLLELAIELNPKNRVHAFHDPDFTSLRQDKNFTRLITQS